MKKQKERPPIYITLADRTNVDLGYYHKISVPEWTFINELERYGSDLPLPVCEYYFALPRKHRADFAWLNQKLLVEVDGGTHKAHGGQHGRDTDRVKLNLATILGFRVLRFSTDMLEDSPEVCIEHVRLALRVKPLAVSSVHKALIDAGIMDSE